MSGIRILNLTKRFGDALVIDNLNLDIAQGEMIALLGPSGCGKSTTLFAVSGIHRADEGQILIGGRDVTQEPPQTRNVGVTFQSYALYPHMTVEQNIGFPLKVRGESPGEIKRKVAEIAALVRIDALLHRKPAELSGGQQQRASLARAIIRRPDVLLMDEPLANLDASLRMTMRAEIRRIQQESGITAILVTHDQVEAMSMCDRIAIMQHGRIVQVDTPVHMYRKPRTEFVAGFLGNPPISLMDGTVHAQQFVNSGARIPLGGTRAVVQGPARAGLRPEHVTLVAEGGNPATVSFVEHQGREILYDLQLANGGVIRTLQSGGPVLKAGESVQWHIEANDVLLFDALGDRLHVA
ncbi:ABC transporter ATP-binding protein [Paraburkholderia mimosarum]|uniref:ABC transporter ATP-binding protein n=1 Tax=Paraburkholderia mimosarum TaxID=312026 RepID=UPI000412E8E1|nr:ABC transporter ATP-binding protein [Paraburkholderia mimosarum]